jgi:hypothetical protein
VVLDLHEFRVYSLRIQTQSHKSIDRSGFRNELECPRLLVLELDDFVVAADDLVAFVLGPGSVHQSHAILGEGRHRELFDTCSTLDSRFKQFRQSEPLARHLVAIIGVYELIIIDAVGRVAFYTLDRWLAGVEGDDVVDESLTGR